MAWVQFSESISALGPFLAHSLQQNSILVLNGKSAFWSAFHCLVKTEQQFLCLVFKFTEVYGKQQSLFLMKVTTG